MKAKIHKFVQNGTYILLDINSGAVHVIDKMIYDIMDTFDGENDAAVIAALALEMLLLGLSLADWDSGVIPDGFLAAILVVWIITIGFRQDIQRFAIEGLIASVALGLLMAIATAITGKIMKAKVSYGPTKLAMCLMLFLGFKGSVIAVGVAVVAGFIFVLAARSKKRKISLAPAISIGFIAAFLVKDILALIAA